LAIKKGAIFDVTKQVGLKKCFFTIFNFICSVLIISTSFSNIFFFKSSILLALSPIEGKIKWKFMWNEEGIGSLSVDTSAEVLLYSFPIQLGKSKN